MALASNQKVAWIKLNNIPYEYFGNATIGANDTSIMAVGKCLIVTALCEYDPIHVGTHPLIDVSHFISDSSESDIQACCDSIAIDTANDIVYLPYENSGGGILKMDLKTNKIEKISISNANEYGILNEPACIVIDDILHMFGYCDDRDERCYVAMHAKYNIKTGVITKDKVIDEHVGFGSGLSIVYVKSQQRLLFTGGDFTAKIMYGV